MFVWCSLVTRFRWRICSLHLVAGIIQFVPLLVFTLITWLKLGLPGFFALKLLFILCNWWVFCEKVLCDYENTLILSNCSVYSFIFISAWMYGFMFYSAWMYGFLFYSVGYNTLLSFYILIFKLFQIQPVGAFSG